MAPAQKNSRARWAPRALTGSMTDAAGEHGGFIAEDVAEQLPGERTSNLLRAATSACGRYPHRGG